MTATTMVVASISMMFGFFLSRAWSEHARRAESTQTAREIAARVHDVRQPIQAIELYASALLRRVEGEEAREMIARIHQAVAESQSRLSNLAHGSATRSAADRSDTASAEET